MASTLCSGRAWIVGSSRWKQQERCGVRGPIFGWRGCWEPRPCSHTQNSTVIRGMLTKPRNSTLNPNRLQCWMCLCPGNRSCRLRADSMEPNTVLWHWLGQAMQFRLYSIPSSTRPLHNRLDIEESCFKRFKRKSLKYNCFKDKCKIISKIVREQIINQKSVNCRDRQQMFWKFVWKSVSRR